jgi:1-acyl-sn-glycerol-3-phosphate acyltransferase
MQGDESRALSESNDGHTQAKLIGVVTNLATELHPHLRRAGPVTLDSDLDRHLALDSLGRAELILRLDRSFGVRLPDRLIGEASTVRDLLHALQSAAPGLTVRHTAIPADKIALPAAQTPLEAQTLIEVVAFHLTHEANRPHLRLWESDELNKTLTYGDLHTAALRVAHGLLERGLVHGDRVAIMLPTKDSFFFALLGVLYAGGIPVPVYPPFRRSQVEDHLRRQAGILTNAETRFLCIDEDLRSIAALLLGLVDSLTVIETVATLAAGKALERPAPATSDTTALIQYTSGSTGDPKGVVLSHANILANVRAMGAALEATSDDIFVSWLPLYHDMGLIGAWFGTLYFGAQAIIMPPLAFLADPGRWLRAMSRHRATLSAAPNFAFELCVKNIRDEDIRGLDLSSLRLVVNGAEPVLPSTLTRFTERFAPYGFRPEMLGPVYGLAENAVGLAFPPLGRRPVIDRIQRVELSRYGRATPIAEEDATALEFVACGRPIPGHEIRIVDDHERELPDRVEGRLQFRGPSSTSGYFRNEEKTRSLFSGSWLESGDRAYMADGDVFITGRIKDMIIKAGRNIYPHELEELVGAIEGVRKGCVAAIASTDAETATEQLVLIVETRVTDPKQQQLLQRRIVDSSSALLDMPPDAVVLVPPHTVPKTSSGKIRRAAMRDLYERGLPSVTSRGLWLQLLWLGLLGTGGRLRRIWRFMIEIGYAAYWWTLLVCLAVWTWLAVMISPRLGWRQAIVRRSARLFLRATGSFPTLSGRAPSMQAGAIFVANHASYIDSLLLCAILPPPFTFVAKHELSEQLIAGPFLRRLGTLFARRSEALGGIEDTARQVKAVRDGARLVSFPEATLTRVPGLRDFHLGAFLVSAETGAAVMPVTIRGTRFALRGDQWFPRHAPLSVHFGEPHRPDGNGFAAAVRLRDVVRTAMLEESREPDLARERIVIGQEQVG